MNADNSLTIGLLWHSPNSDNLGVGALTISNIELVRRAAKALDIDVNFVVIGYVDDREIYVKSDDIEVVGLSSKLMLLPWKGFGKLIRGCDMVIDIGGGDSFTDIYSLKRTAYIFITKFWVLLCSKPLIMAPQTVGPFGRSIFRFLGRRVLNASKMVFVRDKLSHDHVIKELRAKVKELVLTTDVAFALPFNRQKLSDTSKKKIGLGVSGLLFHGGHNQKNAHGISLDYAALMRRLIEYFQANDCEVHLVSHVIAKDEVEDDYRVCQKLADEYEGTVLAPSFFGPVEAKSYISGLDFFTGARMHACIAAASSGVPVVPMAYSRKFKGLFGALEYNHVMECQTLGTDEAFDLLTSKYANYDSLKAEVTQLQERATDLQQAYLDGLTHLMKDALNTK